MVNKISLNPDQQRYVIDCGSGYTCFGFANARDHAELIADRLRRPELAFSDGDFGALAGYEKYLQAVDAWRTSRLVHRTYFGPRSHPRANRVLEACRETERKVRLILGNTESGQTWFDEHDVVGTIGRSMGPLRVPLLIEPGEHAGSAILCDCILAIIAWDSGEFLFRHPAYREPELSIHPSENGERPWDVRHNGETIASFADVGKAGCYVAFMHGATVEPRVFA